MVNGASMLVLLLVFISAVRAEYVSNKYEKEDPRCPLGPVVTADYVGEFGNCVWDYASILALARLLPGEFQPYIRKYTFNKLSLYFLPPLLPVVEDIPKNCSCWNKSTLYEVNEGSSLGYLNDEGAKKWDKTDNIVLRSPSVAGEAVMNQIEFVKSRLRLKPSLIEAANKVIIKTAKKFLQLQNLPNQELTFVGVHVRRGDYLPLLKKEEIVDARFFNFGFDYFRNRKEFGKCVFLVLSDDPKWVEDNITSNKTNSDVFLVGNSKIKKPGLDIAILSSVNHTIFDYGSFGLWGAVYSGGEVITSTSFTTDHEFIVYKRFHFFNPVPDKEVTVLTEFVLMMNVVTCVSENFHQYQLSCCFIQPVGVVYKFMQHLSTTTLVAGSFMEIDFGRRDIVNTVLLFFICNIFLYH